MEELPSVSEQIKEFNDRLFEVVPRQYMLTHLHGKVWKHGHAWKFSDEVSGVSASAARKHGDQRKAEHKERVHVSKLCMSKMGNEKKVRVSGRTTKCASNHPTTSAVSTTSTHASQPHHFLVGANRCGENATEKVKTVKVFGWRSQSKQRQQLGT
jgi:hypothetical protein